MTKLRFNITMSLDGYIAGPNQSVENPLGEGGEQLHEWAFAVRAFRERHGMEGGATGPHNDVAMKYFEHAKAAARGKDVTLGGGASVAQQYLKAGLIDEMESHGVPILLGDGARLFDNSDGRQTAYECVRVVNSPAVSHYKYQRRNSSTIDAMRER
jgi:RibD domain-containing protein